MRWLLDVNALIALAHQGHADHSRMIRWFASLIGSEARLGTCAIIDLVPDFLGADRLPSYVLGVRQVTDGHLLELAKESSMQLATMDKGIPGAYLIP